MDPTQQAFLIDVAIYAAAVALVFTLGFLAGNAGKRKAARRAADQAWRMIETFNRHQC